MPATPIRMTVTGVAGAVVRLSHEVGDGERHDDGYTGAELVLWHRDLEWVPAGDGGMTHHDVEPRELPLTVGQVVEVTIAPTTEGRPVERFVDDDGDGVPDRRVVVEPSPDVGSL